MHSDLRMIQSKKKRPLTRAPLYSTSLRENAYLTFSSLCHSSTTGVATKIDE